MHTPSHTFMAVRFETTGSVPRKPFDVVKKLSIVVTPATQSESTIYLPKHFWEKKCQKCCGSNLQVRSVFVKCTCAKYVRLIISFIYIRELYTCERIAMDFLYTTRDKLSLFFMHMIRDASKRGGFRRLTPN